MYTVFLYKDGFDTIYLEVPSKVVNNFTIEVVGSSGKITKIFLWVRPCPGVRRKEGESLYEPHSEEDDLVPGQGLPHALPPTHSERDEGGVLLISNRS